MTLMRCSLTGLLMLLWSGSVFSQGSFVNWESPHISPLEVTSSGIVLAVNTADNRLEVVDPFHGVVNSIPVGLDPVSVRARDANEVWVANHLSDSISVIDLTAGNVIKTLYPGDEPTDIVFAGNPVRAFVSVSQRNQVAVFDPDNTSLPPTMIDIEGEDPRALATDGQRVYAAIFESGNKTMSINELDVSSSVNPYPGNPNPPPNFGNGFNPPIAPNLPTPPETSIILKKNSQSQWLDDNGGDWSSWANSRGFDLHDHDVAVIDADSLSVSYATGLMNANMAIAVRPTGGAVVVGTDAINEVRFEPNLTSRFLRVMIAAIGVDGVNDSLQDLNPHLDYMTTSIPASEKAKSIGDPRGLAWSPDGSSLYVTGMGSNNLIELDSELNRVGTLPIGEGPTGIRVDEDLIYVLNRFEASISIIDRVSFSELSRISFYDPTPEVIRNGRPFLYNTHLTSGLGQAACGSCHIDARTDKLGWDLGDPQGEVKIFDQTCDLVSDLCEDWHPMKGPMLTQTLVGLDSAEPFHWRGDRGNFQQFNSTFVKLNGRSMELTAQEMAAFEDFVMTIKFPPNPNRNVDDSFPESFPNGGDAAMGQLIFNFGLLDNPFECTDCHAGAIGSNFKITPGVIDQQAQSMKVAQLRNLHERTGRDDFSADNNSGYGFVHDGSFDTLVSFFSISAFSFANNQEILDTVAFMMCFGEDFHAAIGTQVTIPSSVPGAAATIQQLIEFAEGGQIGLIAKGKLGDESRGFAWVSESNFLSDRDGEQYSLTELIDLASSSNELTFTAVPSQSAIRIGLDRDEDGFFDRDEMDACSNPADPLSTPNNVLVGDVNQDGFVNLLDVDPFIQVLADGIYLASADINCDGFVNLLDVEPFVAALSGG